MRKRRRLKAASSAEPHQNSSPTACMAAYPRLILLIRYAPGGPAYSIQQFEPDMHHASTATAFALGLPA